MSEAQNERTNRSTRRRRGLASGGNNETAVRPRSEPFVRVEPVLAPAPSSAQWVRPQPLQVPSQRTEEYCLHHMVSFTEHEPVEIRTRMCKIRHLAVDHFGKATLYCDCLHNGPHEWPPSMQELRTAVELDQFMTDSTNEA